MGEDAGDGNRPAPRAGRAAPVGSNSPWTRRRNAPLPHAFPDFLSHPYHPRRRKPSRAETRARAALRSNSREVQVFAVKCGIGIGCLACFHADDEPDLVRLTRVDEGPARDIWLGVLTP